MRDGIKPVKDFVHGTRLVRRIGLNSVEHLGDGGLVEPAHATVYIIGHPKQNVVSLSVAGVAIDIEQTLHDFMISIIRCPYATKNFFEHIEVSGRKSGQVTIT